MSVDLRELSRSVMDLECYKRYLIHTSLKDSGVYFGQPPILDFLNDNSVSTQNDIAKALRVSPASVAVSIRRLQKSGLVVKVNDENDLRRNNVSITEQGIKQLEVIHKKFNEIDKIMFADFNEEELVELKELLDKIIDNLSKQVPNKTEIYEMLKPGFSGHCESCEGDN